MPPYGTASLDDYVAKWFPPLKMLKQYWMPTTRTSFAPIVLTSASREVMNTGSSDRHLSEAYTGVVSAQEALDRVAKDWEDVTNRYGREATKKVYQESIGYQPE